VADDHVHSSGAHRVDNRVAVLQGKSERFFLDDVLSIACRHKRVFAVELVRRRNIHDLHRGIRAQCLDGAIRSCPKVLRETVAQYSARIRGRDKTHMRVR
jgi:hypothetical protein